LLLEGKRQDIPTGLGVEESEALAKELQPYMKQ
jgi:hypothetical protein